MFKCFVLMCFCMVPLFGKSNSILVADQDPSKRSYSSGINTKNWRNATHPITHQNYSKVIIHNNPNTVGQYVIARNEETQRIYPVYNGHSYGQHSERDQNILQTESHTRITVNDISRNNKTIFKRKVEYKSFEVYEKCPSGETGQFVYALSCNQYLNCWKGRGSPQNCAPGTLFNPNTLECDFPDKVTCITGPRQNSLSNTRVAKSVKQADCPEGFSGLIPNYTDCSKFINCNNGHSMPMDCPPGTLFDTSKSICDHPSKCTCFDGQSGTEIRVQTGQGNQHLEGSFGLNRGCNKPAGSCDGQQSADGQNFESHRQFGTFPRDQRVYQTQYGQGANAIPPQSGSGFQFYPGSSVGAGENNQQQTFSITYNRTNCNPQYQDCGQNQATIGNPIRTSSGQQQFYQTQYGTHGQGTNTNSPQSGSGFQFFPGSSVGAKGNNQQNTLSVTHNRTNCNPQYQDCGQNQANFGNPVRTSSGQQQFHQTQYGTHGQGGSGFQFHPGSSVGAKGNNQQNTFSVTYNRTNCNPQYQNCGQNQATIGNPIQTSSGQQQFYQTQYNSHAQGGNTNPQHSSSGFQVHSGSGIVPQGNSQQNIFSLTYNGTICNPRNQNCVPSQASSGNQQFQQTHYGIHRGSTGSNSQQIGSGKRLYPGISIGDQGQPCNPQYQNCGSNVGYGQTIQTQSISNRPSTYGQGQTVYSSQDQDTSDVRPYAFEQGSTHTGCDPQKQQCGQNVGQGTNYIQTTSYGQTNDLGYGQTGGGNAPGIRGQTRQNTVGVHGCNPGDQNCGGRIPVQVNPQSGGNCDPTTNNCGAISTPGTGARDRYDQTYIHRQNCDPSIQNCGQVSQDQNILGYGQTTTESCCGPSTTEANTRRVGQDCNPSTQNCGQNIGRAGDDTQFQLSGQFICDPRVQFCGQSSQNIAPQTGSGQVSCDLSKQNCGQAQGQQQSSVYTHQGGQGRTKSNVAPTTSPNYNKICNLGDRNCQSHSIVAKDIRYGVAKCPDDHQGIIKHPFDCSKFLNCANGQTFIQDCAPGTLFNQKLGNCDFPYNVECEISNDYNTESSTNGDWIREYEQHIQQFGQNSGQGNIRSTTESQDLHDIERSQEVITDINVGEIGVVSRPTHERSTHRPFKVDDVDVFDPNPSSTPRSVWPPPFPKTNEVDYEFDYEDGEPVTLEPDDVFYASRKESHVCEESDFHCSANLCITQTMVCDGHRDCTDGKDELLCEEYISRFTVHKNSQLVVMENQRWINASYATCAMLCIQNTKFTCRSFNYRKMDRTCYLSDQNIGLSGALRKYIPMDYYELIAGTVDCTDRSKYFECYNSKCIMKEQVCDGADDCGDRQDEKNCSAREFGYSIKLAGSKQRNEGRVEISAFGRTGYVCDDQFGIVDANVVCRELGFGMGAAEVKGQSFFARDLKEQNTQYMMDDVDCVGNETTLLDCGFSGWGIHNCRDQEIAGVVCKTLQENCGKGYWKCDTSKECIPYNFVCDGVNDCSDDSDEKDHHCEAPTEIRLVNGSHAAEGRLEIKHHGIWGTVCDDDFNEDAAKVVCSDLGFQGKVVVRKDGYFGAGDGPIWLDQVSCYGNETGLQECSHWTWGEHNCEHDEDVGVTCSDAMDEVEVQRSSKSLSSHEAGLPTACGYRKDRLFLQDDLVHARVVGGGVAKEGDYPWQAALKVRVKDKSAHWCGAVIVSSRWVLTAAHCLQGYAKGAYVVVAGDYDADADAGTEQQRFVDEFFVHERFRQGHKMNNDIALVRVKGGGFELNGDVQPICLPGPDVDYDRDLNCTVSGFGSVRSGTSAYSHKMMAAWIPIHSREICRMPHIYGDSIAEGMICAGFLEGGVDACDGDSGGPLACLDQGVFTLYGITSWGQHCGYANKPGVYVKVAHYRAWIEDIIQKHSQ